MNAGGREPKPISSRHHPLVARVRKLARRPALGPRTGLFLLDGVHLIEEALDSPYEPEAILVGTRMERTVAGRRLLERLSERTWPVLAVPDPLLDELAVTQTAQGILGLFRRGAPLALPALAHARDRLAAIVLAGLQDPLNLGALARAAHVFACPRLIALADTVDPFHPRALRASAGLLLRLPVIAQVREEALGRWLRDERIQAVALVPREGEPIETAALRPGPHVLVLGSEGHGLPPEIAALCGRRWSIPMAEGVDSLGVAAAGSIALYVAARRFSAGA